MEKKNSTSMYELLSVNELKPLNEPKENKENKDNKLPNNPTPNANTYISTGNFNSLSNFLNSVSPIPVNNTGEFDYQNKTQIIKGDFYSDPEVLQKNCGLFVPETIKNTVQAFAIYIKGNLR